MQKLEETRTRANNILIIGMVILGITIVISWTTPTKVIQSLLYTVARGSQRLQPV